MHADAGDLVGEGPACGPARGGAGGGERGDELSIQAQLVGDAGVQRVAQQLADRVEHHRPGGRGHDARGPARPFDRQRFLALAFTVPLVGDESLGVLAPQDGGVMTAAGRLELQEDSQLQGGPAIAVERAARSRAAW